MSLLEKRILVTGSAGFIGSNLVDALLELRASVVGLDNLYNGKLENLKQAIKSSNFTFYKADIRDYSYLMEICKDIDIIFHEAAFASVPDSIEMPLACNNNNINGTLNILECARKNDVKTIVFASSASVYGEISTLSMRENMNTLPISPYGVSKLACEKYLHVYSQLYGLNTISLRYLNVYGPRQDISPYSGVISKWLGMICNNQNLIIYGDGEQVRDFIYIKDVINANLLAATRNNISGEVFNIGTGIIISINYLAKLMINVCGKNDIKIEYTTPRPGDIREGSSDINKAKRILGFEPNYSLNSGLKDYYEWYKHNKN